MDWSLILNSALLFGTSSLCFMSRHWNLIAWKKKGIRFEQGTRIWKLLMNLESILHVLSFSFICIGLYYSIFRSWFDCSVIILSPNFFLFITLLHWQLIASRWLILWWFFLSLQLSAYWPAFPQKLHNMTWPCLRTWDFSFFVSISDESMCPFRG